jgi:hypothetical protein
MSYANSTPLRCIGHRTFLQKRQTCAWAQFPELSDLNRTMGLKPKTVYELVPEFFKSFES